MSKNPFITKYLFVNDYKYSLKFKIQLFFVNFAKFRYMPKRSGRKSLSQTPAPPKERIKGSKNNPKGSAASEKSASSIKLSESIIEGLEAKLAKFKEENPSKKNVTLNDLKAVYRRGAGAYSSSHRPTISGGKPNTRNAWAMARVNKFLKKAAGEEVKKAYVQDDDLLKMENGGQVKQEELLKAVFPLVKRIFTENGLRINDDYSFTDGSNKSYLPYFSYMREGDMIKKAVVSYFEEAFEVLGEVVVEVEDGKIEIDVEFPNWNIDDEVEFEDGGMIMYQDGGDILIQDTVARMDNPHLADAAFYKEGGLTDTEKSERYKKWKSLVNMSKGELQRFYDSEEGKVAGLTPAQAKSAGIDSGRESARWIMKMKDTPVAKWTPEMWKWAGKQISFISRMSGAKGKLYDEKGRKTRKHLSLLIWGHNPEKFGNGGFIETVKGYKENLEKNGIVLREGDVTLICYNTGNQKRSLALYNQSLIYKTILPIDKDIASKMIANLNNGVFETFAESKSKDYQNSQHLIVMNQNEVLYTSEIDEKYGNGGRIEIEPYYNEDFKVKIKEYLLKLGFEDIEFETDGISFHNPDYDDRLVGKKSYMILNFINSYGYDSDDFGVYGSRIMYPNNFKNGGRLNKAFDEFIFTPENNHESINVIGSLEVEPLMGIFKKGGTLNLNTYTMDIQKFNSLPHITTLKVGDTILIKEAAITNKGAHAGERFIKAQVERIEQLGKVNMAVLKVLKSAGDMPLSTLHIKRPINNLMKLGRALGELVMPETKSFKEGGHNLDDLYIGDEIDYKGQRCEVMGLSGCKNYIKVKNIKGGKDEEIGIDELMDNAKLLKRR